MSDENGILRNIKKRLKKTDSLVVVANDPNDFEDNGKKIKTVAESFDKTGIKFKHAAILDARNRGNAEEIIRAADLIILSGGKCLVQNRFFKEIDLGRLIKNYRGVIIGVSAGTMNLCKTVANFPEEESDLQDPRWFDGLGFFDGIIIPHFDGETLTYQLDCGEMNVVSDYILPMSKEKEFIGLSNDAYIIVDNDGKTSYFGDIYKIVDEAVARYK